VKASTEFDDLIFWNQDGFITETGIANVVIDMSDGRLVTPPVHCGLLAGVLRSCLLKEAVLQEEMISLEQLRSARAVYLINSVRGWMRLAKNAKDSWIVVEEHLYNWLPQRERAGEEHSASLA
jgi:para-aminobenzoate synthetase/4-amino-4-deoxychorismate lyase